MRRDTAEGRVESCPSKATQGDIIYTYIYIYIYVYVYIYKEGTGRGEYRNLLRGEHALIHNRLAAESAGVEIVVVDGFRSLAHLSDVKPKVSNTLIGMERHGFHDKSE
jgi:hypothetical protein